MLAQGLLNEYGSENDEINDPIFRTEKRWTSRETHSKDQLAKSKTGTRKNLEKIGLNTILYGPPGTGKTYGIKEYIK